MARRDKYGLSAYQEAKLMEARQHLAFLVDVPIQIGNGGIELPFGKNTEAHEIATDIIKDIEHLLGY